MKSLAPSNEEAAKPLKKIGAYDILLEEVAASSNADGTHANGGGGGDSSSTTTLRLLSCPHVGNNRLEVLLLMNRNEYEDRLKAGFETSPIVDKLVNIVTQQCVPPGRFLLSSKDTTTSSAADKDSNRHNSYENNDWQEIDLERARQFLNSALLDANTAGLVGFPTPKNRAQQQDTFDDSLMPPPPLPPRSTMAKDSGSSKADENKKRFRRSSLLRRSVSESFVSKVQSEGGNTGTGGFRGNFRASEFGKKKAPNRRHSSFMMGSSRKKKAAPKVKQPEDLDILFNFEQTSLLPNHVGNNRLRVLLNIQKERYEKSDEKEQTSSLQEWVRTVTQFWGGRFLRQEEEDAKTYELLDAAQAELALHSVISELSTPGGGDDMVSVTSLASKKMLPVDSVVAPAMNVQHMRSAAVESLQKRKKRQGLASRLRRLASNALTRNVSDATPSRPTTTSGTESHDSFPKHSSLPDFTHDSSSLPFAADSSVPEFLSRPHNSNAMPTFDQANSSGITSLPTSPTPATEGGEVAQNQRASRRSFSVSLPRFMKGRASLRRDQNLAADGVSQDLRKSLEADDRDFGPEAFGESLPGEETIGV